MLRKILINDYKCLSNCALELNGLNLFSGPNSSGKSSAIQAILIASDNLKEEPGEHGFRAKNALFSPFNEIRNFVTNAKSFNFVVSSEDGSSVNLEFIPGDDDFKTIAVNRSCAPSWSLLDLLDDENLFYLPAVRFGGFGIYPINPKPANKLGYSAEYVIDYFVRHRQDILDESFILVPGSKTLEWQVNVQLEKLTGYRLLVDTVGSNHYVKYQTLNGKELHPYHVGTGVSFITLVVIVCFIASKGGMIIIENPEIHLHPEAQASLIDLMAKIAKAGVQIIIESHSDHFFNGIRRLISRGELDLFDAAVYNFRKDEMGLSVADKVEFTPQGGIRAYIPGMFDQFDKDLDAILGL